MPDEAPNAEYDLDEAIGYLVYKVHQRAFAILRRELEPVGLTPPQFGALALLSREDGLSQTALCETGATDPNTLVGILDRLESAGLVVRQQDVTDRRAHRVYLTPKGRRTFAKCVPRAVGSAARCWGVLQPAEQDRLRRLLRKVLEARQEQKT